ncbi:response regulator [Paenibacillus sp. MBLB4367]|uniref:response regulator transcription factor n=1 Tax=Paenibacillus sp. MBLB4367 TaxID=3384767 RepID=UPI0039083281
MPNEPLTVLVVDDELLLRDELRRFPWEAHGMELIGEAENGEEALQLCRASSPDIVITDITMPVMDGIALFRSLKAELPYTQVILLTCHSDFTYAREAVRLGAIEYLVKVTMDDEDLARALFKAREAIGRDRSLRQNERDNVRWELSERLMPLMLDSADVRDEESAFASAMSAFRLSAPVGVSMLRTAARGSSGLFVRREIRQTLLKLEHPVLPFHWVPVEDNAYLLLVRENSLSASAFRTLLESIIAELYGTLNRHTPFLGDTMRIYAVIGDTACTAGQFAASLKNVFPERAECFYDGESRVFYGKGRQPARLTETVADELAEALRKCRMNEAPLYETVRTALTEGALKHTVSPDDLKTLSMNWLIGWCRELGILKNRRELQPVEDAATLQELIAVLAHEAESIGRGKKRMRKEIADAKSYIDEHLEQPVTLTLVADHVGLSPHYLSRLFREEMEMTLSDFVTKQRMEKAVHLLKTTSLKVYEVANAVGIPSYRYFTAVFKEWVGVAPKDARASAARLPVFADDIGSKRM